MTRRVHSLVLAAAALLVVARPALAGPPLLCFPFDIGAAKSLPMGPQGWESVDPRYNVSHLVDDTLALLTRSEEHTSELQSHSELVCRLLLVKKKSNKRY